jgi:hypothetical protein
MKRGMRMRQPPLPRRRTERLFGTVSENDNYSTGLRSVRTSQSVTNFCHAQQGSGSGSQVRW